MRAVGWRGVSLGPRWARRQQSSMWLPLPKAYHAVAAAAAEPLAAAAAAVAAAGSEPPPPPTLRDALAADSSSSDGDVVWPALALG